MKLMASQILNLFLFNPLKHILTLIIDKSLSCLLMNPQALEAMMPSNHDHHHRRGDPTAALVPVPICVFAEKVKSQLSVMPYKNFLEEKRNGNNDNSCVCIVCLNRIEVSEEVRVLSNCKHVFHKECIDVWVDQGQLTCPLCRAKLLPIATILSKHNIDVDHHHQSDDPYRRERMIYLFGEDYLFGDGDQ